MSTIDTPQPQSRRAGPDQPAIRRRVTAAVFAAATALVLSACSNDTADPGAGSPGSAPGTGMMMESSTASSSSPAAAGQHNDADVMFVTMMIPHHQGAIEMADLALAQAESPEIKKLAGEIKAAQDPEIRQMQGWLQQWGVPASSSSAPMSGMNHAGMAPGSMGEMAGMGSADMAKLKAAKGTEFDRLFLTQMIAHHKGAIDMSNAVLANGSDPQVKALARNIASAQQTEITTMQQLLGGQ
ncbi:DUF305 domain-containing protein [Nakamurella aerolata]|uniref:DUF305 domain-containing protein n=1 Tax=Nakamurella aerolata TaxID=1656892 RepID=A0A849AAS2_9ACTN|nr:DUF305 domain-containing protein [Nakamurella aerolata]NNG37047.1 DUF305 domain-containing protein [Nakamurella aerolata]